MKATNDYPEIYRTANDVLTDLGITIKHLAEDCAIPERTVYSYQSDRAETFTAVCKCIEVQAAHGAPFVLAEIARNAGGLYVPLRIESPDFGKDIEDVERVVTAALTTGRAAIVSLADGNVTEDEWQNVNAKITAAQVELERLRQHMNARREKPENNYLIPRVLREAV